MAEVLRWVGDCFRVVVATIFFLTPGMVFWLVVVGVIAAVHRSKGTGLYKTIRDKTQERLRLVTRKVAGKTS
jgi:hypothetical protein